MWDASDLWYLFKLAIKTATGVVIFGVLGWAFYSTSSGIPKPPEDETEFKAWAEVLLTEQKLTEGGDGRQDILDPFVEEGQVLRRIWGPWESADNPSSLTAYDKTYISQAGRKGKREALARISAMRMRSQAYCSELEGIWIAREREKTRRALSSDESSRLWKIRWQQAECRYWQEQAKKAQAAAQ